MTMTLEMARQLVLDTDVRPLVRRGTRGSLPNSGPDVTMLGEGGIPDRPRDDGEGGDSGGGGGGGWVPDFRDYDPRSSGLQELASLLRQYPGAEQIAETVWVTPTGRVLELQRDDEGNPTFLERGAEESRAILKGISSGGGTSGFDTGPGYLDIANRRYGRDVYEDDRDYGRGVLESDRAFDFNADEADRAELGARASSGAGMLNYLRNYAGDLREAERSPHRFGEYLVNLQRSEGGGDLIQDMIGKGVRIEPKLPDPYADPRFQQLLDSMFKYSTVPDPGVISKVRDAYQANRGDAERFFSQRPEDLARMFGAPAMAGGGEMVTDGTHFIVDEGGRVKAILGEAGPERVDIEPIKKFATGGTAAFTGAPRGAFPAMTGTPGAAAPATTASAGIQSLSPAEGTSAALARTLKAFGYVPRHIIEQIEQNGRPSPGGYMGNWYDRLPPSIRELIMAAGEGYGDRPEDVAHAAGLYEMGGISGGGGVRR